MLSKHNISRFDFKILCRHNLCGMVDRHQENALIFLTWNGLPTSVCYSVLVAIQVTKMCRKHLVECYLQPQTTNQFLERNVDIFLINSVAFYNEPLWPSQHHSYYLQWWQMNNVPTWDEMSNVWSVLSFIAHPFRFHPPHLQPPLQPPLPPLLPLLHFPGVGHYPHKVC